MIIKINNFEKNYGSENLFEKTNLIIKENERVALIGQNGTGKTTLIKCIIGDEPYNFGNIEIKTGLKISVMEQEKEFDKLEITFKEYLNNKKEELNKRKEALEEQFSNLEIIEDSIKYEKLICDYEIISKRCETDIDEAKLVRILENLNFIMENYDTKICNLSGGEKTKLRLAEALAIDADFYILDEPTNHLDFITISWLERRLSKVKKTFLIISHDRFFLSKISTKIVEIEDKHLEVYNSNYEDFLIKKKEHIDALAKKHHSIEKEKNRLNSSMEEKRKWAHEHGSKKLRIIADRLERDKNNLDYAPDPEDFVQNYKLEFQEINFNPSRVFGAFKISKRFDNKIIFENSNFEVLKSDKIALIGENGSGKTTLLKILNSDENLSGGELKIAQNLQIGYFDQEFKNLNLNQKIDDFLWNVNPSLKEHEIISTAIKFGIEKNKIKNKIKTLSGGEKARLSIVSLILKKTNLLLLDEPTNHLDVELIESLEKALNNYNGTIIFISHDRYFINKVANKILYLNDKNISLFEGNYSDNF